MREILFRGKFVLTGEWIYGDFHHGGIDKETNERITFIKPFDKFMQEVIPETVGQYTGLTDKNGTKIFEGDILRSGERIVRVHWNGETLSWECTDVEVPDNEVNHLINTFYLGEIQVEACYGEMISIIIGNIHDNPELLKGGAENDR